MNRHYVHLSMNEDTALQIGKWNTTLKKGRGDNHYLCNWSITIIQKSLFIKLQIQYGWN